MTITTELSVPAAPRQAYEAPRLVSLDHSRTESGGPGVFSDANETVINTSVSLSSAPS